MGITPSQTVGPFFSIGFQWLYSHDLAPASVAGQRIEISGRILDADLQPVPDAIVEIWQADHRGEYPSADVNDDSFRGWGRVPTDESGVFRFTTIKPGAVPNADDKPQSPHINVAIYMRGLLRHLWTRLYFDDEAANASDSVLGSVPADRRHTLLAKHSPQNSQHYTWDVILQGNDETVFFDW